MLSADGAMQGFAHRVEGSGAARIELELRRGLVKEHAPAVQHDGSAPAGRAHQLGFQRLVDDVHHDLTGANRILWDRALRSHVGLSEAGCVHDDVGIARAEDFRQRRVPRIRRLCEERGLLLIAIGDRHACPAFPKTERDCARCRAGADEKHARAGQRPRFFERAHSAYPIGVVPDQMPAIVDDRVHCTDPLRHRVEPVDEGHHLLFERLRYAQTADAEPAHPGDCSREIAYFEWHVRVCEAERAVPRFVHRAPERACQARERTAEDDGEGHGGPIMPEVLPSCGILGDPLPTYTPQELTQIAAIADALPVAIFVSSATSGETVYANRAFEQILGRPPRPGSAGVQSDVVRTRGGAVYPVEAMPFVRVLRERADVTIDDIVLCRDDGRRVFIRAFARPLCDAAGDLSHVVVTFTDISEEVESRSRAGLAERRLQHLLASAPLILFAFDRHGIVTLSEGKGLDALGFRPRELLGQSVFDLYAGDPVSLANAHRVLAGEEFTVVSELGAAVLESNFRPVLDEAGEVDGALGVSIDITERFNMQSRLVQAERLASMGTLSATVAHEINNPLTYVLGNLEFVAAHLSDPATASSSLPDLLRRVEQAREGADRVRRIVRGLQSFSRQEDDRVEPTDVHAALERALEMADNAVRHRARVVRRLGRVPPVLANDLRLGQVFVNLLLNAAQAIPEGHAETNEIRVVTRHDEASGWVVIAIEDTGAGIAPGLMSRIFEPFFTTKPVGSGTGLGLSICIGIVTGFGGSIEVESVVGEGSTFRVLLPWAGGARKVDSAAQDPAPVVRRGRLLIVDDDANVARSFAFLLDAHHDVEVSLDPRGAAQRIVAGERFDIVFCDLMMPDMTGMDFHGIVEKGAPEQAERVVFVTGGAFTHAAREFVASVPNTFLDKPFDRKALDAVLLRYLG
jgi:PAS domain S-box-containing protein